MFVTVTVQVVLAPALTPAGEAVFPTIKLYWQGTQSIEVEPTVPLAAVVGAAGPEAPVIAVGAGAPTVGEVAITKLEPPPPPPAVALVPTVEAPPPPPE